MAKRKKASGPTGRKAAAAATKKASPARKAAGKRTKTAKKTAKAAAGRSAGRAARSSRKAGPTSKAATAGKGAGKAARKAGKAARKAAPKPPARKAAAKKTAPKGARTSRPSAAASRKAAKAPAVRTAKAPARGAASGAGTRGRGAAAMTSVKKAAAGGRPKHARNPAPIRGAIPSSLGLEGGASAARSGRDEFLQHIKEHTESSPAITAGDVDADWQLAYSSGDEAPGGDNPTPDQDIVDEIGKALGVNYDDNEELKGAAKIEERDKHRWELDPASKDDFDE